MRVSEGPNLKILAAAAITLIVTSLGFGVFLGIVKFPRQSIAPNYNGFHLDFYGIQPPGNNTVYTANNPNPCLNAQCPWVQSVGSNGQIASTPYYWQYNTNNAVLQYCPRNPGDCQTTSIVTNVYNPNNNPVSGSPSLGTVSWKVPWPSGCSNYPSSGCGLVSASGNIFTQNSQIQLSPQTGSDVNIHFQGVTLWFRAYSTTYNRAYPVSNALTLPNGTLLGAWSTVIATQFTGGTATGQGTVTNVATTPGYTTGQYTMNTFTVPQTSSAYYLPYNQGTAAQTIQNGNPLSPDSQMYQETFISVTLNQFGSYGVNCFVTCSEADPQLQLNFQSWLLQMGQYILTSPQTTSVSTTTYSSVCTGLSCVSQSWNDFWSNPFNWLGALLGSLLVGGVGIIILLAVFAGPVLIALIWVIGTRKKGER